jgi:hypothetical protein
MRKEVFIEITTCCGSFLCQIESEISRTRDVSQWNLIEDRGQISDENLFNIRLY